MKKLFTYAAYALVAASVIAPTSADAARPDTKRAPFAFATKAKAPQSLNSQPAELLRAAAINPQTTLTGLDTFGYLDGPDGSTWFYTANPDIETVVVDGGGGYTYTEYITHGYEFTIYDSNLKKIGTIKDKIKLAEGETKAAAVMLSAEVTQKFFNNDENYEVIVSVAYNKDQSTNSYPAVSCRSMAYSIGAEPDADGNSVALATIDGYVVASVNAAADKWSENYYFTFLSETGNMDLPDLSEAIASCKYILNTYKKAGYSGEISLMGTQEIPLNRLPGDQMNSPFFMSFKKDGKAWFVLQQYEKDYYLSPVGDVEGVTPDNNLKIQLFSAGYNALTEVQTTLVPTVQSTGSTDLYTYYSIGYFRGTEDVVIDGNSASFYISKQIYSTESDDDYIISVFTVDANGNNIRTIAESVDGFMPLSDINGYEPQVLFLYKDDATSAYTFSFVDIESGTTVATLPSQYEGCSLTTTLDRAVYGDSYCWVISNALAESDTDGNAIHKIFWIAPDGKIVRTDAVNLGQNIAYAQPYISSKALSPYFFNTDSDMEYMFLVKRYLTELGSTTEELLNITKVSGESILTLTADPEKGDLSVISTVNVEENPQLLVVYVNGKTITQDIYSLPLEKFTAGGDGTAANPYVIATVADLQQIKANPNAYYILSNDIDAAGFDYRTIDNFSGSLDGKGHSIFNLTISGKESQLGLFGQLASGAKIKDLTLENVTYILEDVSYAGTIAAIANGATISGVHVIGLSAINDDEAPEIGGLVGRATLNTAISESSVTDAEILLPRASDAGGIAGTIFTGTTIKNCLFTGTLVANRSVGGIVGSTSSGDENISDCHVNADIAAEASVGGIIGVSNRSVVANCYVEGSVSAQTTTGWTGPGVGGVIGELARDYAQAGKDQSEITPIVKGNVVNLRTIAYNTFEDPDYATQYTTAHRIIGYSSVNDEPDFSYDENWNIIYGDPAPAELALADNYAVSTLDAIETIIPEAANTVEGASVDPADLNKTFFEKLGFKFGNTAETPWQEDATSHIILFFETEIQGGIQDITDDNTQIIAATDNTITADGCRIDLYTVSGSHIATAYGTVSTANLQAGIYIAVATTAQGTSHTLKIAVK